MNSPEPWMTLEDVTQYLKVSKETVYRLVYKKKIPCHKIGRLWRFKPSEVDNWIMTGSYPHYDQTRVD